MNILNSNTVNQKKEVNSNQFSAAKDNQGKIKNFFLYGRCFLPLLLAHHPECEIFGKSHTINIGKYKFCIGCFVGYPTALLALIIFKFINIFNIISSQLTFILSLIFLGSFILSPLNLTKIKNIKIIQKVLIGIGAVSLFLWIRNLPTPRITNILIIAIVFIILISIFNLYHILTIMGTCYKCKTPFDWGNCQGFKSIRENMKKCDLYNFLKPMEDFSRSLIQKREEKKSKNI